MSDLHPPETWRWYGNAGHLCVSDNCLFHLTTKVGNYLVSTVGEWHPYRDGERMQKPETIGCDRLFETMVFKAGEPCSCGCGMPKISGSELMFKAANLAGEANKNHLEICEKLARGYNPEETNE